MTIQMFGTRGRDGTTVSLPLNFRSSARWVPKIGDQFPDFTATTTQGQLHFADWSRGHWTYFFSHPAAFTPVCTTEMAGVARNMQEFSRRNVKVVSLSRDHLEDQQRWLDDLCNLFDLHVDFPTIADAEGVLARACGMIHPNEDQSATIRKSFVIDPQRKIRMIFEYPSRVGRSVDETLRVIDALQEVDRFNVATPGGWVPGDALVLPPEMSSAEASRRFGDTWETLCSYLRVIRP